MVDVSEMVEDIFDFRPSWVADFKAEMRELLDDERPDNEKWIAFFKQQAKVME